MLKIYVYDNFIKKIESGKLLKSALKKYLKTRRNNENLEFEILKNQWGKPYLANIDDVYFNISHSDNIWICAIDKTPVGIDIQKIKNTEYTRLARRFFTANEYEYIAKRDKNVFFKIWSCKESIVKLKGISLKDNLKNIEIDLDNQDIIKFEDVETYTSLLYEKFSFAISKYQQDVYTDMWQRIEFEKIGENYE